MVLCHAVVLVHIVLDIIIIILVRFATSYFYTVTTE